MSKYKERGYLVKKSLHFAMIRYTPSGNRKLGDFQTPFEKSLSPKNRWVRLAELIPWDEMAEVFFSSLSADKGRPTVDLRIVLGALMVKHIEGLSDEDTIEYIQENVYAQYFVGLEGFQPEPVFVPSLFVEIRKRLGKEGSAKLNDLMIKEAQRLKVIKHRRRPSDEAAPGTTAQAEGDEENAAERNRGTLLVDATAAPMHIAYPTDSGLLNHAREHTEALIDRLFASARDLWPVKPRTYRRQAKKEYVSFSRKRKKDKKAIRKIVGKQLRYVRRNLKTLDQMLDKLADNKRTVCWTKEEWRTFWIIWELFRQQDEMFRDRRRRIDDRIISIEQPHLRPIKRGKGGNKNTEFGPKLNVSMSEGIARVDRCDFNAFHEASYLQDQIEGYKGLYGYYPALVLADQIYWTRSNRNYLKDRNIRQGGVPLGRKGDLSKYEKRKRRKMNNQRSEIEGKFGQAKLKYGLDELFTRRPKTTMTEINLIFLAINLLKVMARRIEYIFVPIWGEYISLGKCPAIEMINCAPSDPWPWNREAPQIALCTSRAPTF